MKHLMNFNEPYEALWGVWTLLEKNTCFYFFSGALEAFWGSFCFIRFIKLAIRRKIQGLSDNFLQNTTYLMNLMKINEEGLFKRFFLVHVFSYAVLVNLMKYETS